LIGRNEAPLLETSKTLQCNSSIHAADVTDEKAITDIAAATGTWDVLILAAGYLAGPASIRDSSVDEWWKSFEVADLPLPPIPLTFPNSRNGTKLTMTTR
jgi:NADP-dependent 3-hydroxy acid dehydrogenase YdfG